jgi:hypothetical protein
VKLRVWVEVFTVERYTEDIVEVSDEEWAGLTDAERVAYMLNVFEDARDEIANGGCEEVEE